MAINSRRMGILIVVWFLLALNQSKKYSIKEFVKTA
jgi:hypothetical protein